MANYAKMKITGWTMACMKSGVVLFVTAQTQKRSDAIDRFLRAGYKIADVDQIKPVTMVPGHEEVFSQAVEFDAETCKSLRVDTSDES